VSELKGQEPIPLRRFRLFLGRGEFWALTSALAYALTTIFVRAAVQGYAVNYLMGVTLRTAPTFAFALFMVWRGRRPSPQTVSPWRNGTLAVTLIGYGLLSFVAGNLLHFSALQTGGVLVTTPLTGTQALWAGVIAAAFLRQPLNRRMVLGMVIAVGGIALLVVAQSGGTPVSSLWWLAVPTALGAALCWSLSGVLVAAVTRRGADPFRVLAVATGAAIVALILGLALAGDLDAFLTTPPEVQGALLLAGLCNTVALIGITIALAQTSVASATTLSTLQIALAPLLAWLFLGEPMSLGIGAGILVIAGGIIVVQRARSVGRG